MPPNVRPPFRLSPQMRRELSADLPPSLRELDSGAWQTFDFVSPTIAAGGQLSGTLSFPVTAALCEIQGAATSNGTEGTAELAKTDLFTVQFTTATEQLNAGSPVIGTAYFNRLNGIKTFKKPWILPANQAISIAGASLASADNVVVYITFTVLLLELSTNAVQFGG